MNIFIENVEDRLKNHWIISIALSVLFSGIPGYFQYKESGEVRLFWILIVILLFMFFSIILIPGIYKFCKIKKNKKYLKTQLGILEHLKYEFDAMEKTMRFHDGFSREEEIRAVAYISMEGKLSAVLNIGQEENTQTGSKFILYRLEKITNSGDLIEEPLAIVEISNIQSASNLSIALVDFIFDINYWEEVKKKLKKNTKINPPYNILRPYLMYKKPTELSLDEIKIVNSYLDYFHNSLVRTAIRL